MARSLQLSVAALDGAVDKAYGSTFPTEARRMEHLFSLYEAYINGGNSTKKNTVA